MSALIPFNLERALAGEPVVTREGIPGRVVAVLEGKREYPVVAILKEEACDCLVCVNREGESHSSMDPDYNLFMAPKVKTWWFASRPAGHDRRFTSNLFNSEQGVLNFLSGLPDTYTVHSIDIPE